MLYLFKYLKPKDWLFSNIMQDNSIAHMHAAGPVERITAVHPDYLQPYKKRLLTVFSLNRMVLEYSG